MKNNMYTTSEAALKLKISRSTLQHRIQAGQIETVQIGSRHYIKRSTMQKLLDERRDDAKKLLEIMDKQQIQQQVDEFISDFDEFYDSLKDCTLERYELDDYIKYIAGRMKSLSIDLRDIRNDWRASDGQKGTDKVTG